MKNARGVGIAPDIVVRAVLHVEASEVSEISEDVSGVVPVSSVAASIAPPFIFVFQIKLVVMFESQNEH